MPPYEMPPREMPPYEMLPREMPPYDGAPRACSFRASSFSSFQGFVSMTKNDAGYASSLIPKNIDYG